MSFFKKLSDLLFGSSSGELRDPNGIYFYVKCAKCGSPIRVRADKRNDLMRNYETNMLTWNKDIMDGSCFSLIHAEVIFDPSYRIISQEINGGEFIDWDTYKVMTEPKDEQTTESA